MKKIEKLNVTTKMLLVLLYSFVLLLIAVFVINLSDAREESKGYGTKARDEYIQVFSKVIETRSEPTNDETNLKKETSRYSIYTQITQTTDKNVKNTTDRLELNKYCSRCQKHTAHKEKK